MDALQSRIRQIQCKLCEIPLEKFLCSPSRSIPCPTPPLCRRQGLEMRALCFLLRGLIAAWWSDPPPTAPKHPW